MNLSTRQLRVNIGKLKPSDTPVIITRYSKPVFVLVDINTWEKFLEVEDFNYKKLHRENELLKKFLKNKGFSVDDLLKEAEDHQIETTPPIKSGKSLDDFKDEIEKLGFSLGVSAD